MAACRWWMLLPIAIATVGCGASPVPRLALHGRVTFNGQPIADGTISLHPVGEKSGPAVTGIIQNGDYRIDRSVGPTVGSYRVEIEGFHKTGRQVPDFVSPLQPNQPRGMFDEKVPYIPEKFNTNSTLTANVTTETDALDFDLVP